MDGWMDGGVIYMVENKQVRAQAGREVAVHTGLLSAQEVGHGQVSVVLSWLCLRLPRGFLAEVRVLWDSRHSACRTTHRGNSHLTTWNGGTE
jgi:hypothetical protein